MVTVQYTGPGLARSYLMTLYAIFPIHVDFAKAMIHRKKQWIVLRDFRSLFLKKKTLFMLYMQVVFDYFFHFFHDLFLFFMFLYLSFICYFCHITFYTRGFFSIFAKDFPFSSFPLIF